MSSADPGQALHYALDAIELQHLTADAHFLLAISLIRLRRPIEAMEALKMTIAMNPAHVVALKRLAMLVENRLHDHEYAARLRSQAEEALQETRNRATASPNAEKLRPVRRFAVASGRPAIEQDPELPALADSPTQRNHCRCLRASSLRYIHDDAGSAGGAECRSWQMNSARPMKTTSLATMKISESLDCTWIIRGSRRYRGDRRQDSIAPLVRHLPLLPQLNYGVILMLRDIPEILRSQQEMLAKLGRPSDSPGSEQIAAAWREQISTLRRLLAARNIPVLPLEYRYCLLDPEATAEKIRRFLNAPMDTAAMASAIQPNLTRQTRVEIAAGR
ncbi:MAG UNVERIFIED_CONTAM: hypothetical protein LVR18_40640 [Planctomycetaceae bacterium]